MEAKCGTVSIGNFTFKTVVVNVRLNMYSERAELLHNFAYHSKNFDDVPLKYQNGISVLNVGGLPDRVGVDFINILFINTVLNTKPIIFAYVSGI